jgi:hypothetical protein
MMMSITVMAISISTMDAPRWLREPLGIGIKTSCFGSRTIRF